MHCAERLEKIRAFSGRFQRYPDPDCSGKLKEVSSSVWAAARWGRPYYISIYFPQHWSNFSQARLMTHSVSDNLKLCGGHLNRIRRDYEFCLVRKWTVCPNVCESAITVLFSFSKYGFDQAVILSVHKAHSIAKGNNRNVWEYLDMDPVANAFSRLYLQVPSFYGFLFLPFWQQLFHSSHLLCPSHLFSPHCRFIFHSPLSTLFFNSDIYLSCTAEPGQDYIY